MKWQLQEIVTITSFLGGNRLSLNDVRLKFLKVLVKTDVIKSTINKVMPLSESRLALLTEWPTATIMRSYDLFPSYSLCF